MSLEELEEEIVWKMAEWNALDRWIEKGHAYTGGSAVRRRDELTKDLDALWARHELLTKGAF